MLTRSPATIPWFCAPKRDGSLPGEHPGPCLERGAEGANGVDQLQGGADRPLGVVLVRDGRPPDGHHRIADELLDGAPVPLDQVGGGREVSAEQLADMLRVAVLRERGEANEIREEHRDQASLRRRGLLALRRVGRHRGAARFAEAPVGAVRLAARGAADGHRGAALVAEATPDLVLMAARGAAHRHLFARLSAASVPDARNGLLTGRFARPGEYRPLDGQICQPEYESANDARRSLADACQPQQIPQSDGR